LEKLIKINNKNNLYITGKARVSTNILHLANITIKKCIEQKIFSGSDPIFIYRKKRLSD